MWQGINGTGAGYAKPATNASLVDPDERTALEFIPVPEINGVKFVKVNFEDIEEEVNYLQNVVICCVMGANPALQSLRVMSSVSGRIMQQIRWC